MLHLHPKRTQAETACDLIRTEILDGRLPPGAKLNIKALEERFALSLGAVREALSRLGAEGMVVGESHRGYRVTPVSSAELLDLTRARIDLESLCLAQAMQHGDVEWETRIVAAAHRMERLQSLPTEAEARSTKVWNEAHGEFHQALVSACPNQWLLRMRHMLYEQSERYRRLSVPLSTDQRDVRGEHRDIMEAALRRDRDGVYQAMERHLLATAQIILRSPELQAA